MQITFWRDTVKNINRYKLLIIDDEWELRSEHYNKTLSKNFDLDYLKTEEDLKEMVESNIYDGFVLDIFLKTKWRLDSGVVINDYLNSYKHPVFTVSEKLQDMDLTPLLRQYLKSEIVRDIISFGDFKSEQTRDETISRIYVELDKWYRRDRYIPDGEAPINILHISDTQFGDKEFDEGSEWTTTLIRRTFEKAKLTPHLVVVSGDLTYSGKPSEFSKANLWFSSLSNELFDEKKNGMLGKILYVPGNHDVNLQLQAADYLQYNFSNLGHKSPIELTENTTSEFQDFGLQPYRDFVSQSSDDYDTYLSRYMNWGIEIVLLSSVGGICIDNPSVVKTSKKVRKEISQSLKQTEAKNFFRILVTHHPALEHIVAINPSDPTRWEETSYEEFARWMKTEKIDLWLSGHAHGAKVGQTHSGINCCIAAACTLNPAVTEGKNQGFFIISLSRKNGFVKSAKIFNYKIDIETQTVSDPIIEEVIK